MDCATAAAAAAAADEELVLELFVCEAEELFELFLLAALEELEEE